MLVQSEKPLSVSGWRFPKSSSSKLVPVGILGLGDMGLVPGSGRAAHTLTVSCLEILRHPPRRLCVTSRRALRSQDPRGRGNKFSLLGPDLSLQIPPGPQTTGEASPTQPRLPLPEVLSLLVSPAFWVLEEKPGTVGGETRAWRPGDHIPLEKGNIGSQSQDFVPWTWTARGKSCSPEGRDASCTRSFIKHLLCAIYSARCFYNMRVNTNLILKLILDFPWYQKEKRTSILFSIPFRKREIGMLSLSLRCM